MTDLRPTITPKSDQLNADSLIAGPITITITKVLLTGEGDQPVAIHYEGGDGKPYKACKSMRRVLVHVWGGDGNAYVGRRLTLFRDEKIQFGGYAVGGIRISHMSNIDREVTVALTVSRANRKPFTVRPLPAEQRARQPDKQASDRQPATPTAGDPPLANGGGPVEESPSTEASNDAAKRDTLAGPDVDILDWAASWNRGLAQLDTVAEVVEAVKAAKAGGYVLKLRGSNPGMAKALMEAADARVGEIESQRGS